MGWGYDSYYPPYVPVAVRRAKAEKEVAKRQKSGQKISPVKIEGLKITKSFWGNSWCKNLESYSDYSNRLPRGRTYVRNGSVVDLQIEKGQITALVSGSELYQIQITISELPKNTWTTIKKECSGQIGSLVELLQGKLSKQVMEIVTRRDSGLFPKPREIKMRCSCPDSAGLCKHLAAVMFGVGHRLDTQPELLFKLRQVDHLELMEGVGNLDVADQAVPTGKKKIAAADLSDLFGIEMTDVAADSTKAPGKKSTRSAKSKSVASDVASKPVKKSASSPSTLNSQVITETSTVPARKKPARKVAFDQKVETPPELPTPVSVKAPTKTTPKRKTAQSTPVSTDASHAQAISDTGTSERTSTPKRKGAGTTKSTPAVKSVARNKTK